MTDAVAPETLTKEPTWFGHPRGLTVLFLTETTEKFSYYGMRAILVLYMTKHLLISQATSSWIYGTYTMAAYITPVFGGFIADRLLGRRAAVMIGGSIMAAGHFMLGFEPLLFPGLAAIAIGNGLFLPTLPSQIGALYRTGDPKQSWAYNVYYMGINVGATIAPLACGGLAENYGWHWGFTLAGVVMVLGLLIYTFGTPFLPKQVREQMTLRDGPPARQTAASAPPAPKADGFWRRSGILILVVLVVIVFRGAYEQLGNTISLWAYAGIDRNVLGDRFIPASWFQSVNPAVVILFSPLLIGFWAWRAKRGREASTVGKMVLGAVIVGVSYLGAALTAYLADKSGVKASWVLLSLILIVLTIGELYILPVGLGLFGRLAPRGLTATTIAIWFSAIAFGNFFAGFLGTYWTTLPHGPFFAMVGGVAFVAAALLIGLRGPVKRLEAAAKARADAAFLAG
jgi:POT family proton-dependent oligopeptide transporter